MDKKECCKHFAPMFPTTGEVAVDTSLMQASKLNMAFAFQKTSGPVTLPELPPAEQGKAQALNLLHWGILRTHEGLKKGRYATPCTKDLGRFFQFHICVRLLL